MAELISEQQAVQAAEVVNDAFDGVAEVVTVFRHNPVVLAGCVIVGVAAGAFGGYSLAKKHLNDKYDDIAQSEIDAAKRFYSSFYKVDEEGTALTPQDILAREHGEEALEALQSYRGQEPPADPDPEDEILLAKTESSITVVEAPEDGTMMTTETQETVEVNVFRDPTFDLEEEKKYRTDERPYIISHEEFFSGEYEYDAVKLTYFEDDDTLVDERDQPVEDTDAVVGDDHLVRFGTGSKDKNIVYVRNDRLKKDFEVVKGTGSYLEALGLGPEPENSLRHSDERRSFRRGEG